MTHPTCPRLDATLDALEGAFAEFASIVGRMDAQRESLAAGLADLMRESFRGEIETTETARIVARVLEVGRKAEGIGARLKGLAPKVDG